MSYSILIIRHSVQGVIGNTNTTTQYDGPMVAATAISGSRFVCLEPALRPLAPPGLPLSAASAKPPRVAAGARIQGSDHGQSEPPADSSCTSSLPAAAATHQPGSGSGVGAMVGTKLCPWLRATSTASSNVFFNTVRIAVPQPNWPGFTKSWHRTQHTTHRN